MIDRLTAPLREAPTTVPALAAVALFVVWGTDQAGYPVTHWAPGGLIMLALLAIALATVGLCPSEVPLTVKIAVGCLAGYTALSFLSILWAAVPGDAWEGADRTLLYLLVFSLFALWPQTGRSALIVLVAWTLAIVGLAGYVALHVDAAAAPSLRGMFPDGRLVYPTGYANANAALWLMAFWPALLLARSEQVGWILRGVLAGGAVLLAEVALLGQSRGSLYATPVMLLLVFALLPGRARTFALLVPVAAGIGAAAPTVLHVGNHLHNGVVTPSAVHSATAASLIAALAVALAVAAGAAIEGRLTLSEASTKRIRTAVGAGAVAFFLIAATVGLVAAGRPVGRVKHAWETFKSPRGYAANSTGSRLTSGLGSQRYDFYRVALDEFAVHPLAGIGADNFQQPYLRRRRSYETPHYPHSLELRTLAQTGVLGTLLALVGLAAALLAAARAGGLLAARGTQPLGRAVAAAAFAGFGYWFVHGSFDWFFEFAGLGAPAFGLLGLTLALAPRVAGDRGAKDGPSAPAAMPTAEDPPQARPRRFGTRRFSRSRFGTRRFGTRRFGWIIVGLACAAAAASFLAPWLSGLQIESATRVWPRAPLQAYERLNSAAELDPLSDEAYLLSGSIALRFGDLARADREFSRALGRVPGDAYATLELGAIASVRAQPGRARMLLRRAVRLDPRDRLAKEALAVVTAGGRVNLDELNRTILLQAQQLA
jgi:tetratricopeptide (TPR) repeat protein